MGLKAFSLLVLVGFCGWVAQEGVAKAVGLAPAARMAPINYLQVVIAWLADVLLFESKVYWTDIVGTILVLIFSFMAAL